MIWKVDTDKWYATNGPTWISDAWSARQPVYINDLNPTIIGKLVYRIQTDYFPSDVPLIQRFAERSGLASSAKPRIKHILGQVTGYKWHGTPTIQFEPIDFSETTGPVKRYKQVVSRLDVPISDMLFAGDIHADHYDLKATGHGYFFRSRPIRSVNNHTHTHTFTFSTSTSGVDT